MTPTSINNCLHPRWHTIYKPIYDCLIYRIPFFFHHIPELILRVRSLNLGKPPLKPLLENVPNIFNRVKVWRVCWKRQFLDLKGCGNFPV